MWLEGACHSYGGLPGWPFVEILLGWLGGEIGEPEIAIRTKARASLGALFGSETESLLHPLAGLLRIRLDAAPATEEETDAALVRWVERLAATKPVIIAIEDTQWADGPTRRLAGQILELTDRAPIGLVLTEEPIPGSEGAALRLMHSPTSDTGRRRSRSARSRRGSGAGGRRHRQGRDRSGDTNRPHPRGGRQSPLSGGVARAYVEGALEPRGRTWTVTIGSLELLPPSLENLLVARIDRQSDEPRRLAQIAAAIGRTFPVWVLERVSGDTSAEALKSLLRAQIVREVSRYPEFECIFTHGLLREAALSTLTSTRKRALYAEIASAYEELYRSHSTSTSSGSLTTTHRREACRRRSSMQSGRGRSRASARATSSPHSRAGSRGRTRSSARRCRTRPRRRTGRAGSSARHARAPGRPR